MNHSLTRHARRWVLVSGLMLSITACGTTPVPRHIAAPPLRLAAQSTAAPATVSRREDRAGADVGLPALRTAPTIVGSWRAGPCTVGDSIVTSLAVDFRPDGEYAGTMDVTTPDGVRRLQNRGRYTVHQDVLSVHYDDGRTRDFNVTWQGDRAALTIEGTTVTLNRRDA